ncbi:hypothetical protein [Melittangium boletus]|uniref:Uncharacterized protein n=1 Tax=Melittangium boletus DSM 14713 TaxID=1294270 RepID=A0A250IS45_9BACT|nr:hypothetical protein [Melittangium boletus]ATB34585.1 hypothetical protein MEBOL_008090 [Melittangium boletus DSM 14713]
MTENAAPVSPAPDASRFSTADFVTALRALPSRPATLLLMRLAQGRSLPDSASFYGISPDAFSIHLLRAALALTQAATLPVRTPENDTEEDLWARVLAESLEREAVTIPPSMMATVALCKRMRALGPELTAALRAAERAEEDSPKRRREDWLRRLAVLALLGLTAYLYLHRTEEPPERPPAPRSRQR